MTPTTLLAQHHPEGGDTIPRPAAQAALEAAFAYGEAQKSLYAELLVRALLNAKRELGDSGQYCPACVGRDTSKMI